MAGRGLLDKHAPGTYVIPRFPQDGASMSITITLRGRHYTVRSDEAEEDLVSVASWVDRKIGEIARRTGGVSEETITLLACLNIANEYHRFRKRVLSEISDVDRDLQAISEILEIMAPGGVGGADEPDEDTEDGNILLASPEDAPEVWDENEEGPAEPKH
jgi:cell division protein ZapA (FtsZ GTPase activity inhibitor)